MPISSGALDWPASYYSKPDREAREVIDGGEWTPRGAKKSPRGANPQGYEWQPQLTNREEYEKWRKEMDRKVGVDAYLQISLSLSLTLSLSLSLSLSLTRSLARSLYSFSAFSLFTISPSL